MSNKEAVLKALDELNDAWCDVVYVFVDAFAAEEVLSGPASIAAGKALTKATKVCDEALARLKALIQEAPEPSSTGGWTAVTDESSLPPFGEIVLLRYQNDAGEEFHQTACVKTVTTGFGCRVPTRWLIGVTRYTLDFSDNQAWHPIPPKAEEPHELDGILDEMDSEA